MRLLAVLLALALSACGPSDAEKKRRATSEALARITWEGSLGLCRELRRLAEASGAADPAGPAKCLDADDARAKFVAACSAASGDAAACELRAQGIERLP